MFNKHEISEFLRKLCVYLSFDKSDEQKVYEYLKQVDDNDELKKKESIQKSDIIIFFLTKNFIESDQFKEDWSKRGEKVYLIILIETIQTSSFNLNEFSVNKSISSSELMKKNKIFLSRLINLKKFNLDHNIRLIDANDLVTEKIKRKQSFLIKKMEFLDDQKVILKSYLANSYIVGNQICVIDLKEAKTFAKIEEWEQEFCWINHLYQIFIYQKPESNPEVEEASCSLYTIKGTFVRSVYSLKTNQFKVNSISYNKDKFEVYLNVFDKNSTNQSILILNKDFCLSKTIISDLTAPDFPLNYASEVEIFNIRYNIFHYNSNIAFLQEKCSDETVFEMNGVKIFDKISYSVVGVIKTVHRLVTIFENKMLFMKYFDFNKKLYLLQNIPNLNLGARFHDTLCKINPLREPHLLSNPYVLPCSDVACFDCINDHFNIFKRSFQCEKCKQEHKNEQEFQKFDDLKLRDFLNKDVISKLIDENKISISKLGKLLMILD